MLGMAIGPSEAEPFWTGFLRSLTRHGLRGVKLVISDAHEGLKAAAAKVLSATWQRCRVHFLRNALAHAGKGQRHMVLAAINTAFTQESFETASQQWRAVADQLHAKFPKLADLMDAAESDVLAFMNFPKAHRVQIHSTDEIDKPEVILRSRRTCSCSSVHAASTDRQSGCRRVRHARQRLVRDLSTPSRCSRPRYRVVRVLRVHRPGAARHALWMPLAKVAPT